MADSISTIENALIDNADFIAENSVSKAKIFVTRATQWLILRPDSASNQGSSLTMKKEHVENLLLQAQQFVAANDTSNNARTRVLTSQYWSR